MVRDEDYWDTIEDRKQYFLDRVRRAYHDVLENLHVDMRDDFTMVAQEALSLYSPWMATPPEEKS